MYSKSICLVPGHFKNALCNTAAVCCWGSCALGLKTNSELVRCIVIICKLILLDLFLSCASTIWKM